MGAGRETRRIPRLGRYADAGPAAACRSGAAATALGAALVLGACGGDGETAATTPATAGGGDTASAPAGTTTAAAATTATTTAPTASAPASGFDGDGLLRLAEGTQLFAVATQPDGRVLVAGLQGGISAPRPLLMRLRADGRPDLTFGRDGVAPATGAGILRAIALRPDGRIVVAGERPGRGGMLVARYTRRGAPDRSFGRGGSATVLGGDRQGGARALDLTRDGGIVLGGSAVTGGAEGSPAVARLSAGGTVRRTTVLSRLGPGSVDGIAIDGAGRTLVAGFVRRGQFTFGLLGRLTAGGAEDRGFGGGLRARQYARRGAASALRAVAVLPGGAVLATGWALDGTGGETPGARRILLRTGATGAQRLRLEAAARSSSVDSQAPAGGSAIAPGRRRTWVTGSWDESGSSALATEALKRDGTRDRTFGTGGLLRTPFQDYARPLYGTGIAIGRRAVFVVGTAGITPSQSDRTAGVVARLAARDTPTPGPEVR